MKNERILHADDSSLVREGIKDMIKAWGDEDGHQIIGSADSVEEVECLLKGGLKPTVALVDHKFPREGDGERAAGIIRELSPRTVVISLSSDEGVTWGDYNLLKIFSAEEFVKFLTNLKH